MVHERHLHHFGFRDSGVVMGIFSLFSDIQMGGGSIELHVFGSFTLWRFVVPSFDPHDPLPVDHHPSDPLPKDFPRGEPQPRRSPASATIGQPRTPTSHHGCHDNQHQPTDFGPDFTRSVSCSSGHALSAYLISSPTSCAFNLRNRESAKFVHDIFSLRIILQGQARLLER